MHCIAGMAELADAPDLGSGVFDVQVQVLLPAPELKPCESAYQAISQGFLFIILCDLVFIWCLFSQKAW